MNEQRAVHSPESLLEIGRMLESPAVRSYQKITDQERSVLRGRARCRVNNQESYCVLLANCNGPHGNSHDGAGIRGLIHESQYGVGWYRQRKIASASDRYHRVHSDDFPASVSKWPA